MTVILEGISKVAAVLSVLMKVCSIPCHDKRYINIMLVLQSNSDPLSSETNATSDGVCNFSNTEVQEDVVVIEEIFISVNEEVDRGIKQEEIPGEITFPDIKSEPDEVSNVCICLLLDTFVQCPGILDFFVCLYFLLIETAPLLGIKKFSFICVCVRACACAHVCRHVIAYRLRYIIISM